MQAKLAVIIDDQPKVEIPAEVSQTPDGANMRLESTAPEVARLAIAAGLANRRIALAAVINDKVIESHSFRPTGSTSALAALIRGCKIVPNTSKADGADDYSDIVDPKK
jgi:hypothetical protein